MASSCSNQLFVKNFAKIVVFANNFNPRVTEADLPTVMSLPSQLNHPIIPQPFFSRYIQTWAKYELLHQTSLTNSLHLTLAMVFFPLFFWHSWFPQLPLTQLTTAYFSTDSSTCMASLVLHSPGFPFIWQIEHGQSPSMTTSRKSLVFSVVSHRVLCLAQSTSSLTQNLFMTWFSVTLCSLSLLQMILSSKSLSLHRTFNLQYLLWKLVSQTSRTGYWKTNLN